MGLDLSVLDGEADFMPSRAGVAPRAVLALFEEDPGNPRFEHDAGEFELLVADVRARGILQPLVVRRLENGRLRIRFGARRYRAALAAGLADAPYVVTEDVRQFDDYAQVAENERRSKLQPLELATFAARKIAEGDRKALVAERIGIHPSAVTHLLCLAGDVPPFLLELYHARRCRTPVYLYRLLRLWRRDPHRVEAACAASSEVGAAFVGMLEAALEGTGDGGAPEVGESAPGDAQVVPAQLVQLAEGGASESLPTLRQAAAPAAVTGAGRSGQVRLFGMWKGAEVLLVLRRRPSCSGMIVVRCRDGGDEVEAPLGEILLSSLVYGADS